MARLVLRHYSLPGVKSDVMEDPKSFALHSSFVMFTPIEFLSISQFITINKHSTAADLMVIATAHVCILWHTTRIGKEGTKFVVGKQQEDLLRSLLDLLGLLYYYRVQPMSSSTA
ncbi:hypothetical protein SERLA73DRAFT_149163 [Serpula lacrymans var. lacrymans S7.3]|uniref:Uncharacterized protein n=1 Tax=Serpula lacrymans var. lacrymans (strain S7.3) TaxID=936435 RepID=F8PFY1_SERL3|nr:hypothetical protein SERLA73DRAFT_149163 [Serpula lacrymans var. lacrymans S7.3]